MRKFFEKLFFVLEDDDRSFIPYLVIFAVLVSIVETSGFALVMPFVSLVLSPDGDVVSHLNAFLNKVNITLTYNNLILVSCIGLLLFYVARASVSYAFFKTLAWYSETRFESLTVKLFDLYFDLSYASFTKGNSSEKLKDLSSETARLATLVSSLLLMISELFIFLFLYGFLLWINPLITAFLTLTFTLVAFLIYHFVVSCIRIAGKERAERQEDSSAMRLVILETINS